MTATVYTTAYEFAHGKKPRNEGHWGFLVAADFPREEWASGSYGEAKREVLRRIRGESFAYVEVLP